MRSQFTLLLFNFTVIIFIIIQDNYGQEKYFKLPSDIKVIDYLPKTINFKVKPAYRNFCNIDRIENASFNNIIKELGVLSLKKKFPEKKEPERSINERGEKLVDLSLIYELSYQADTPLEEAINSLYFSGIIEYAEPHYIHKPFFYPNDPNNGVVYALTKMKVFEAWNISTGDTNIVIGITDSGIDFEHPDLTNNIKYNYNDTINGIDDDEDGYVDNYRGWDTGENDNNPQIKGMAHGVHVAGTAAASTDNAVGVSGVGYKCKFLPVKVSDANEAFIGTYAGIVYAADMGCQIINCSWGGSWPGQFGQDVVNYATFNKNALVVCASGNENNQTKMYPASYNNAFSVASTVSNDSKSMHSNYGYHIDVSAPGEGIYSTLPNNSYGYMSGTSMASPNVAGAAAIVKSRFPFYSALQIGEQLKVTADNITNANNNALRDKLGTGRINLFRALTDTSSPSVVMTERTVTINNGNSYHYGDTLIISGEFLNYLAPTVNLSANLTTSSPYLNIVDGSKTIGIIPTYGIVDNNANPFKAVIISNAPLDFKVTFKLTLNDGFYYSRIYFDVDFNLNKFYINVTINDVATSITSRGKIGYLNQAEADGLGFTYMGSSSILSEAGLMVGNSESAVSSSVKGTTSSQNDFTTHERIKNIPNAVSEFDVTGSFNDNNAINPLNILINYSSFAWSSPENRKFIIVSYSIKNRGSDPLNNLYAGIFADWNIMDYTLNKADFDAEYKMGYVKSTETNGKYAGIVLLSTTAPVNHYAIDNVTSGNGGIDLSDGFNMKEKYNSLTTHRPQAGIIAGGTDVISVVSSGPYNLLPGDSAIVAFALLAGDSLEDLQASAVTAQNKYNAEILPLSIASLNQTERLWARGAYPNPAQDQVTLEFALAEPASVKLHIFTSLGQEVAQLLTNQMDKGKQIINIDISNFENGIYLYRLEAGEHTAKGILMVTKNE